MSTTESLPQARLSLGYMRRSPIVYRSRAPRHVRAGAGGLSAVRGARAATSTATEGTPHVHD